jgi:hypothetical protein
MKRRHRLQVHTQYISGANLRRCGFGKILRRNVFRGFLLYEEAIRTAFNGFEIGSNLLYDQFWTRPRDRTSVFTLFRNFRTLDLRSKTASLCPNRGVKPGLESLSQKEVPMSCHA